MEHTPLVTVLVTTYNQEKYIAQALDSVLAQKTDFPFEIYVSEDCGTDGTREKKGRLEGQKLCFVGDGNNMANSLIVGGLMAGMQVSAVCPEGCEPSRTVLEYAKAYGDKFTLFTDPKAGAQGADVVYTDAWISTGSEEEQLLRRRHFRGYQVNEELLALAKPDCMVLHCLPARKGEEIAVETFERHADEIFEETENRLHAQKAVLAILMGGR